MRYRVEANFGSYIVIDGSRHEAVSVCNSEANALAIMTILNIDYAKDVISETAQNVIAMEASNGNTKRS